MIQEFRLEGVPSPVWVRRALRGLLMRLFVRWGTAAIISLLAFAASWWLSEGIMGLNEGAALGIAGALLAVVLAVAGWRAGTDSGPSPARVGRDGRRMRMKQKIHGKTVYNVGEGRLDVTNYDRPSKRRSN
jgi:hypothetical protein